jgi:hypothetical protein
MLWKMPFADMKPIGCPRRSPLFHPLFIHNLCHILIFQALKPDLNKIPPLDVHWVWHVHMLSPVNYREDCTTICGTVIDHKLLSADEIQQRYEQVSQIYFLFTFK